MFGKNKAKEAVIDLVPLEDVEKLTILDLRDDNSMVSALTTDQVFQVLKQSVKTNSLPELKAMVESCEVLKENLEMTGQNDLLATLSQRLKESGKEYAILSAGYSFYLYRGDVNDIIDRVNKDKGFKYLKMTRLDEYRKLIPTTVAPLIKEARELFSTLYVLHTDPKGEDTVEEKRVNKDKDPILFGMATSKSEKMYFIASWEDKWCDFTLNRLLDEMAARLANPNDINFDTIPTTVEELVDAIDSTAGVWNTIHVSLGDFSATTTLASSTITYNNVRYTSTNA